jgi:peptidyl-prolyl cis-trans isomerase C
MKRRIIPLIPLIILVIISMSLASGCGLREKGGEEDEVLATVDGAAVTLSEYKSALEKLRSQLPKGDTLDPEGVKTLKMNLLNQLIEKKLLMAEARKLGITVSESEINEQINKIMGEYPDTATFNSRMKEENIDIASWKKEIEYQIMLDKLVKSVAGSDITVTPEEIRKYYDDHLDQYNSPTRVRAMQIMLETREQAQTILDELKKGTDFSELAKTYSISPDSEKGGDLGYFSEDEMPPAFAVVFKMKPGEVSEVVESEYGFHIFKLIDRREAKMLSLEEARPEIEEKLKRAKSEEKYGAWFEQIRKNKKIEVNPSALEKIKM